MSVQTGTTLAVILAGAAPTSVDDIVGWGAAWFLIVMSGGKLIVNILIFLGMWSDSQLVKVLRPAVKWDFVGNLFVIVVGVLALNGFFPAKTHPSAPSYSTASSAKSPSPK